LIVTFTHDTISYHVPGYFAADANAANSGSTDGNKWRVHFTPDKEGEWGYVVSFHAGEDIAISEAAGTPVSPDGITGSFIVLPSDKTGKDFRSKGRLAYQRKHYLQHQGSGEYFIKTGADSPETLLACRDFDQTYLLSTGAPLKDWEPHLIDWKEGDPAWRDSLGKGIIGAINYLASEEQNAISFLTMNINGDGDNVWPYADPDVFDRFDCSKLDQWEILFEHCDHKGIFLHFKTQEEENDQLLDGGELGRNRKLYYRELIARFGHHLGLNWNLGEENSNTDAQRKAFSEYIAAIDPYDHPIVVHTFPGSDDAVYTSLLGEQSRLAGASLQGDWEDVHALTLEWVTKSEESGKPWVVANDEQGIAFVGVPDDAFISNPTQDDIRKHVLWGNLMAGGAGVEYYFGYALPHNDLNCEDFRSRDRMWDYNRFAKAFFEQHLPYWRMQNADHLVSSESGNAYCFALADSLYVVYLPEGGESVIDLSLEYGEYDLSWYDPRNGGALIPAGITLNGGQALEVANPPYDIDKDWVFLLRRISGIPEINALDCAPASCREIMLRWNTPNLPGQELPLIEASANGEEFFAIVPMSEVHCSQICSARVAVLQQDTWYRLRYGNIVSNTVKCHNPCAIQQSFLPIDGRPPNIHLEKGKGRSD
jgi:hypothetical protein